MERPIAANTRNYRMITIKLQSTEKNSQSEIQYSLYWYSRQMIDKARVHYTVLRRISEFEVLILQHFHLQCNHITKHSITT